MSEKKRNNSVDILRGIAMLLVVLGHTLTGITLNSEDSFLFNIIWSLQMPMFMLISGYVTKYSKSPQNISILIGYIEKKTMAYLIPWAVWTIFIRGIIFQSEGLLQPRYLLWHMDSGYWFLFSIWMISIILGVSEYLTFKIVNDEREILFILVTVGFYIAGMGVLVIVGILFGFSFLCIKLTLYYMPFYFIGYMFGKIKKIFQYNNIGKKMIIIFPPIALAVWLIILTRINLYELSDSGMSIIIRMLASVSGCIAVASLCKKISETTIIGKNLMWCGTHSLEIYLTHYLFLDLLKFESKLEVSYAPGISLVLVNFLLTITICFCVINLLSSNPILNTVLFGKKK